MWGSTLHYLAIVDARQLMYPPTYFAVQRFHPLQWFCTPLVLYFLASAKTENYATYGGPTHILSQQLILTSTYTALKINYTDLPSSGIGMEFQVGLQFHSIPLVMPIPFQPIIIPLIFPKAIA